MWTVVRKRSISSSARSKTLPHPEVMFLLFSVRTCQSRLTEPGRDPRAEVGKVPEEGLTDATSGHVERPEAGSRQAPRRGDEAHPKDGPRFPAEKRTTPTEPWEIEAPGRPDRPTDPWL